MIGVMLFTCDRPPERTEYALMTLAALRNLRAPEEIWVHIADDGSDAAFRDEMVEQARAIFGENTSVTNSEGRGYGASYNLATQVMHQVVDLLLPLEDDWELTRELDLAPIAGVIRDGVFGCVRMGYIGFTQELRGKFVSARGMMWLALDPESPDPHVFTGGPRLESVEFEKDIGPWMEGLSAGEVEFEVAHRTNARRGIAWPVDLIRPAGDAFLHIGTAQAVCSKGSEAVMQRAEA
jgi:hypothetical protein